MTNNNKQKLELTWIGKNNPEYDITNIEPRILEENPELSNCANDPNTGNMIIHGDNLLALKALLPEYEGKVKCIYIDPPYNTGNAFEHYDDSVENSTWLSLMKPRLELMKMLLREDGVIFVNIDEVQHAYLKVLLDEIFGRKNFIGDLIWKKRKGGGNDSRFFALDHDYIIVFAKGATKEIHKRKWRVSQSAKYLKRYKEIDENKIKYYWDTLARDGLQHPIPITIDCPDGTKLSINSQKSLKTIKRGLESGHIRLIKTTQGWTLHHRVYIGEGQVLRSIMEDTVTNKTANDETIELFGIDNAFDYPKPEGLIKQLLELVTTPNDLVLDSFLGSATTAAVAHKMRRKYVGIEMGNHAYTHCKVRLDKVIDGTDQGGISKAVEWKGGGAYKFYELAPSFIVKDEFGNPVIDSFYNDTKLIKAMCRLMNFRYQPSQREYWKHGIGQGKNYLYVTTQLLTSGMTQQIAGHLAEGESLIISPKKYEPGADIIDSRITIRKIPQSVLKACHFGKKEYLLPIKETAMEEVVIEEDNE